jgi:hypothetical protein
MPKGDVMLLLAEIGLTVAAWKKGWRAKALLPAGVSLTLGLLLGIAIGLGGGTIEAAAPVAVLADLAAIGVLIGMVRRAPNAQTAIEGSPAIAGERAA